MGGVKKALILLVGLVAFPCLAWGIQVEDECSAVTDRRECGHSGTDQAGCEAHGCCWSPLDPDPQELPWCFYKAGHTTTPKPNSCDVPEDQMEDCGHMGSTEASCEAAGCCWQPITPNPSNRPWCHKPSGGPGPAPTGPTTPHPHPPPSGKCAVEDDNKLDCGIVGTEQQSCEAAGCCWKPLNPNPSNLPWCYYSSDYVDPCGNITWNADGPGFTDDFYNLMLTNYKANLNIDGSGAVVAAPDKSTPGGSYYYHWMRDAGLSIKAWLDIHDNEYAQVEEILTAYTGWVKKVQGKTDPNHIDVRIEPKFEIPSGNPYTGGWCRPQTDGPALRAMALSKWGMILQGAGKGSQATSDVWPLVEHDLEWVTQNWDSEGCDLWEEVRSKNFYFNRAGYIYSLNIAADFADMVGQESKGQTYRTKANEILEATKPHYGKHGNFIYETDNRPQDGAVIHSIATFGQYIYGPESDEAAATIKKLTHSFCREYKVNQDAINSGQPGILIGRYPGDHYAGGNPWQLLTAVLGETFYLGAKATLNKIEEKGLADYNLGAEENKEWINLLDSLNTGHIHTARDLAAAQLAAGDSVMSRLWEHVKNDGGRIDEQIDRATGEQKSAQGLTWSYANTLHALHVRKQVAPTFEKPLNYYHYTLV